MLAHGYSISSATWDGRGPWGSQVSRPSFLTDEANQSWIRNSGRGKRLRLSSHCFTWILLRLDFDVTPLSLRCPFASLRSRSDFTSISLQLTSMSLRAQVEFISMSRRFHVEFVSVHFDVTTVSLRYHSNFTAVSLRFHFGVTSP